MMSRKLLPGRTSSSDFALSMPIEVPSPPLSLTTAVAAMAALAASGSVVQVGEPGQLGDRFEVGLGQHPGLAGGEHSVGMSEHRDRPRVHAPLRHQVLGLLQSVAGHGKILGPGITDR